MLNNSFIKLLKIFFLLILPCIINAQSIDNDFKDSIPSENNIGTAKFDFLMIGVSYTNNNIKYKSLDNKTKIPSKGSDLIFYHHSGFWGSINYTNYFNASSSTYETEFRAGYQHTFLDFIDIDLNYGYHHFTGDKNYEGITYNHTVKGSLNINSKYVSLNSDFYSMHGLSNNYFIDLAPTFNLDFDNILFKNDFFLFNPSVSLSFGTDDWIFEPFTELQRRGRIRYLTHLGYKTGNFDYQGLSFYLPIIYSFYNVSFSFSWFYNLPSDKLRAINWDDQSGVLFSIMYSPSI